MEQAVPLSDVKQGLGFWGFSLVAVSSCGQFIVLVSDSRKRFSVLTSVSFCALQ